MCLSSLLESYDSPSGVIVSGSKTFKGYGTNIEFENYSLKGTTKVPLDKWIKAEQAADIEMYGNGKGYPSGFHVYAADQKVLNERRVYVRNIHTKGMQDGKIVYVAAEMYVPSNPNGWPPLPDKTTPPGKKSTIDKLKNKFIQKQGGSA